MVKIAFGKSQHWYENYCCVCGKKFGKMDIRYIGRAIFMKGDEEIKVLAHEDCAKVAMRMKALEQLKRGEFGE